MSANFFKISKGLALTPQSAAPSSPSNGELYYDSVLAKFRRYENSSWKDFSSGSGLKSYITGDSSDFEAATGSWGTYDDGSSATPVDGTAGAPSVVTIARTTTAGEFLSDAASLKIAKTAADGRGEGASIAFTIDAVQAGKELDISFLYKTSSAYVNNFYRVFVYDVTNATLINVATVGSDGSIPASASGGLFTARFTTVSTSTSYRLIIHATSTDATAFNMFIDDVKVSPKFFVSVPVVEPWTSFSPTVSNTTNNTRTGQYRRVGDSLEVLVVVDWSGAGAGTTFTVTLPNSLVIDTAKLTSSEYNVGGGVWFDSGTSYKDLHAYYDSTTTIGFREGDSTNIFDGSQAAASDFLSVRILVPIVNWDAGAVMSTTQAETRSLKFSASMTSAQTISSTAETTVAFNTVDYSTHGTGLYSAGVFTTPISGYYRVAARITTQSLTADDQLAVTIYQNAGVIAQDFHTDAAATSSTSLGRTVYLNAGDAISVRVDSTADASYDIGATSAGVRSYLNIEALPDFSVFGVTGTYELLSASSSAFSLTTAGYATNEYAQMTGNSLALSPGTWLLTGELSYALTTATVTRLRARWSAANGDNTTSTPTELSTVGSVDTGDVQTDFQINTNGTSFNSFSLPTNQIILTITSGQTIYLNSNATFSAVTTATMTTSLSARRLK